jgi:hypothetical protein
MKSDYVPKIELVIELLLDAAFFSAMVLAHSISM